MSRGRPCGPPGHQRRLATDILILYGARGASLLFVATCQKAHAAALRNTPQNLYARGGGLPPVPSRRLAPGLAPSLRRTSSSCPEDRSKGKIDMFAWDNVIARGGRW